MDRKAWHAVVHWVAKSWTWLSGWTELNWFIYFNWRISIILWCFLPYVSRNQPQVHMCPPSWTPTDLPPHLLPLGFPTALALGVPSHSLNSHWSCILHMVMHMFQCYSLKSSHPCLFPLSPKVCSLRLCLLCCPACRMVSTVFLNSTYVH